MPTRGTPRVLSAARAALRGRSFLHLPSTTLTASLPVRRFAANAGGAGGSGGGGGGDKKKRFFDRLLPDDQLDPKLREFKERERRVIKEQLSRSKLSDALRAQKEKLFIAPPTVTLPLPENKFPETPLQAVASGAEVGGEGGLASVFASSRATLVTIAFQGHGQMQLNPWHDAVRSGFGITTALPLGSPPAATAGAGGGAAAARAGGGPLPAAAPRLQQQQPAAALRVLNILFLQGWFFRAFAGVMLNSTKNALPPDLVQATAIAFQPSLQVTDHFCDKLKLHNRMMGYAMLVDPTGHVRWRAHGVAAPEEPDNLVAAARLLIGGPGGGGGASNNSGGGGGKKQR